MLLRFVTAALTAVCLHSPLNPACADEDEVSPDVERLQQSGEIISRDDLLKRVHAELPGKVVDARLQRNGDRYIYDVTVLTDKGIKQALQFDARSGELLNTAEEESEDGAR